MKDQCERCGRYLYGQAEAEAAGRIEKVEAESIRRGDALVRAASKIVDLKRRVAELERYGEVVAELCPETLFNEIESEFYRRQEEAHESRKFQRVSVTRVQE